MTLADLLKEDLTTSAAINSLVTKETSELEHAIRCFKPRYNKPLPDRTWKWEFYLGDLASEEVRDVVRALYNYKGCRDKISFEPMRAMQQPESEKKLWTWIKKTAPWKLDNEASELRCLLAPYECPDVGSGHVAALAHGCRGSVQVQIGLLLCLPQAAAFSPAAN